MRLLIMSDIHGNYRALKAVLLKASSRYDIQGALLLGDIIDYGMNSNEVIELAGRLSWPVLINLQGNHENAIVNDSYERFSSQRGRVSAEYTGSILKQESWNYIREAMNEKGWQAFACGGKSCLAVHGSLEDVFWGTIRPDSELQAYQEYDYVFSGHSHEPHFFEKYYRVEDPLRRNRKKVIFINPGSVGQPRNLNPCAQFALLDTDTEEVILAKADYDIAGEQRDFNGETDIFYRDRLEMGI